MFHTLLTVAASLSLAVAPGQDDDLPVIVVDRDNVAISTSCVISIPDGAVIADTDGNGVIHIAAPDITVRFAPGSVLRGNPAGREADAFEGIGIRVDEFSNVTLSHISVRGYKVGVLARKADGLTVEDADLSDNFRQRLKSSPQAEDVGDWLWPHTNDGQEWRARYGAALCIETSSNPTVRRVLVRRGQNGIMLDRVTGARVYDNDCSFLSGWGLAMWRTSESTISNNAFDFCIRGHVEGVYNRGQDSAGILMFEQCNSNVLVTNSATHGGDGFFGFAGKEAIGDAPPPAGVTLPPDAGCNDNLLLNNDFSYAAAHGIELTFSARNQFIANRLVENAICGVWGGYSNDTLIARNTFEGNGGMAYGLERGGVNIEHGSGNWIIQNTFTNNRCAIHLWWDNDAALLAKPGILSRYRGVTGNIIRDNEFTVNDLHPFADARQRGQPLVIVQLRDAGRSGRVTGNVYAHNTLAAPEGLAAEFLLDEGISLLDAAPSDASAPHERSASALGATNPLGARAHLAGRANIIMDDWGPWDHASPMARLAERSGTRHIYEVFGVGEDLRTELTGTVRLTTEKGVGTPPRTRVILESPEGSDVHPYALTLSAGDWQREWSGTLIRASWEVIAFPWAVDPRENLEQWRKDRLRVPHAAISMDELKLDFRNRGPRDMPQFAQVRAVAPGADRFGISAVATINLPKGVWRFTTLSDDGVSVRVKHRTGDTVTTTTVIENWTWHAPTRDVGLYNHTQDGPVTIEVEYFEIDGYAVLKLDIEPEW
ncbi:MAG: right-handed parallel beta-helix repeat-containing protein [Phycisphaeraceae bacterium]|nr:right-handed parallel beta-helix repeat-containing protein [Phycisphaeraceae bacterium]